MTQTLQRMVFKLWTQFLNLYCNNLLLPDLRWPGRAPFSLTYVDQVGLLFPFDLHILCNCGYKTPCSFPRYFSIRSRFILQYLKLNFEVKQLFQIQTEICWNVQKVWIWVHLKLHHLFSKESSHIRWLCQEGKYQRAGEKYSFMYSKTGVEVGALKIFLRNKKKLNLFWMPC